MAAHCREGDRHKREKRKKRKGRIGMKTRTPAGPPTEQTVEERVNSTGGAEA